MIAHRHSQRLGAEAQKRRAEAGLNFICVHLNRSIRQHGLSMISITGPGHGGPGLIANACLEATYSELYPNISRGEAGMKRLFKQVSFPGGELGYALSHAYGAAFDNPDQIVACVVGDARPRPGR